MNVVLAAHRDDHPQFPTARAFLEDLVARGYGFTVPDLVAGAFLRIATNRRIFTVPTGLAEAFGYLGALRAQPGHVTLAPGPRHLELLERVCTESDAVGDLVPDAQLAALAVEHGCEVVSFDRDFARFQGVRWSPPAMPPS